MSYYTRFQRLDELEDIEKSIEYNTQAVALTPKDYPDFPYRLAILGASHYTRFQRTGELGDIERSIEYNKHALDLTPQDHQDLPDRLDLLAASYLARFRRLGMLGDIEKSIEYDTRALDLTPQAHSGLPDRYASLGASYHSRFLRLGKLSDIEKSIEYETRALDLTPRDHTDLPVRLARLGSSYYARFQRLGKLNDIEKSIEYKTRALDLTPQDHPDLSVRLSGLGASHYTRFQRLGESEDIDMSLRCDTRALDLTPKDHPDLPDRLDTLGSSYYDRFQHVGELEDIQRSIEFKSRAVDLTSKDHPKLPDRLASLGSSCYDRFQRTSELEDIGSSIEYQTRALDLTPKDHPDLPSRLANLGVSYYSRFQRLGELDDIQRSIEYITRAGNLTPKDHPNVADIHHCLALSHFRHFQHTGEQAHLQHSLDLFRKASQSLTAAPRRKFQNASKWAELASDHHLLLPTEAYQATIDLLPQFVWLGATINQRYKDLLQVGSLAVEAASAAIHSLDYPRALEWLEHARCVVWNQSLMIRSPLDQLGVSHPDLATDLHALAKELHDVSSATHQAPLSCPVTPEQHAQQRRRLALDYNALLGHARTLPGFENFLQPMKAKDLLRVAQYGTVVVINCYMDHCDALLVIPGQAHVSHLPLPDFTADKAHHARSEMENALRNKGVRERGVKILNEPGQNSSMASVLELLWKDIVKPILHFLGYIHDSSTGILPHIIWCPTGVLSFLPLHAAGDYTQPRSRVFDYVISSYTPTLSALFASSPSSLSPASRILAIGQKNTPHHSPLPGTANELKYLSAHAQNKAQYSQLIGNQATTSVVLDAMEHHDWVHLACHAHQNVSDPTKSGFHLHDGTLDLASINRRSFKNKGLAFLSACQTATGDEQLPDEAIHLASGMLMAGYSSVIATMWSVRDEDAPFVADKVYAKLMKDGKLGNGEAGKALHHAVAELRNKIGEQKFECWVPYIHIGS
ncbi:aromatic di-alanine and TPR containing protein [Rhizoctonia solani AG-3 Rhs1AP]|uniref:Aromatic di-alanine and TPR containing protein n=1 Tax=Rhizoctonia solani AG-3 Rhs1AP TaxID=1086054 RepID=A0A0A1UJE9_9AGAM|nr:aromatic di-alanine and TPR containing protein [Rhizoctonia solani AG-3 Rhs1AP]